MGVDDGTIRLWDSNNWGITKQARNHKKAVSHIIVDEASNKVMISGGGNKLILWAAKSLKMSYEYKFGSDESTFVDIMQILRKLD